MSIVESDDPKFNRILKVRRKLGLHPLRWRSRWREESPKNNLVLDDKIRFEPHTPDDKKENDPFPSPFRPKKESKDTDMNQIRKDGSVKESVTFGNIGNFRNIGNIGNTGNISNIGNIGNTPHKSATIARRNSSQSDTSMSRKSISIEKIAASKDKISNDPQTTADIFGNDRKKPEEPVHREHNPGDDDMTKEPTK